MSYKVYSDYTVFDAEYRFAERAGFQLTKLQIEDVHQFLDWENSKNFYEVGGGKTVVSSVVALMRGNTQKIVTVPPVLITPWAKWLNKISENVLVYRGTPKERKALNLGKAHWIVVSHAIFRDDSPRISAELAPDAEIIVDEAQALKNPVSVLYKKVDRLCKGL